MRNFVGNKFKRCFKNTCLERCQHICKHIFSKHMSEFRMCVWRKLNLDAAALASAGGEKGRDEEFQNKLS